MAEPLTIYKLTILYMLDKSDIPLSNSQITNFFLDMDYTDYFSVQEVIASLLTASLIYAEELHSTTMYHITSEGQETLNYFHAKISEGIEEDILHYFEKNQWEMRRSNSVTAKYIELNATAFQTTCQIRSGGRVLIELKMIVSSKEQAEAVCSNWKTKNEDMYEYMMDQLVM